MQSIKAETPCYSYNITPCVSGVQGQDKSWLDKKNSEVSREMASEQNKDSGIMRTMDEMTTLVENGKEQQENIGKEDVGGKVERKKEKAEKEMVENAENDKVEVEEEEIRMRRHSPRVTLPMQRREESKKSLEETRRVSPRFQGGGGKISKEAEEAKIYLFGLA